MRHLGILILLVSAVLWAQSDSVAAATSKSRNVSGNQTDTAVSGNERFTIPAGTKVPLALKQGISTKSARPGDPVYAQTNFPIAINGRMLIPAGTYVQGAISRVQRGGRLKGRAEILMHFTSLIYPNGYTVLLPGSVDNLPGADHEKMKGQEGTIQEEGQTGKKVETIASSAGTGAVVGGLSRGGKGAAVGVGVGGVAGMAIALLTRGNDVRLEPGTGIDMIIQREVPLDEARIHALDR
jgi:type IV secretion system protein VirB10